MTQKEIADDIMQAVQTLRSGGLILYPTDMQQYSRSIPDVAWDLIDYAQNPLTLIVDGAVNLAPNLVASDASVAIRVTRERISHDLCYRFQRAVVSTSANVSGQPAPRNFMEIAPEILQGVDYVMKARQNDTTKGRPSQIVKITKDGQISFIRK